MDAPEVEVVPTELQGVQSCQSASQSMIVYIMAGIIVLLLASLIGVISYYFCTKKNMKQSKTEDNIEEFDDITIEKNAAKAAEG